MSNFESFLPDPEFLSFVEVAISEEKKLAIQ
jgi:hypothetical protein